MKANVPSNSRLPHNRDESRDEAASSHEYLRGRESVSVETVVDSNKKNLTM